MKVIAFFVSLLGLGGVIATILFFEPTSGKSILPFFAFYTSVFVFTAGIFSFASVSRIRTKKTKISTVLRQGSLLGLLACGLLLLQQFRLLSLMSGALVVGLACLIEFGFLVFSNNSESKTR